MKERYNETVLRQLLLAYTDKSNTEIANLYNKQLGTDIAIRSLRREVSNLRKKLDLPNTYKTLKRLNINEKNASKNEFGYSKISQIADSRTIEQKGDVLTENITKKDFNVSDGTVVTIEDALNLSKVDTTQWEIDHHIWNSWTTSAIGEDGEFKQINNIQVKIWFKRKIAVKTEEFILKGIFEKFNSKIEPVKTTDLFINKNFDRPTCLLISMTDFHLEKRTLDGKNIYDKISLYKRILDSLLNKAVASHNVEEIVFVASSDFLHTDNYQEATTKLTPQQSLVSWSEAYEHGFNLMVDAIYKLKHFCERLTIIHVPSNHSKTKEYYLIHGLSVMFANDKNILFDRTPESTKVYTYGENFLGFHHGDVKSTAQLPNYFSTKFKKEWGNCKYAEIALGDKHHRKEWKQALTRDEVNGTRMFICPSLSGTDIWHKDNLYDLAISASIARVYDKEKGFCSEFEERV